jgi:hypothetical protein
MLSFTLVPLPQTPVDRAGLFDCALDIETVLHQVFDRLVKAAGPDQALDFQVNSFEARECGRQGSLHLALMTDRYRWR